MTLEEKIAGVSAGKGEVVLIYLAQAGYVIKTPQGTLMGIDLYLTDCCNAMFGMKRQVPVPIEPGNLKLDLLVSTHAHADHLDPEALPIFAKNSKMSFLGAPDCREGYRGVGIADSRYTIIARGERSTFRDIEFKAIYADHGELAPEAIGLMIKIDGVTIYHTGDTALRPEEILSSLGNETIDVMILPINGAFGNLNAAEACELASVVKPRIVIPCHYDMFAEYGCDPAEFTKLAGKLPAGVRPVVMEVGEMMKVRR